MRELALFAGAGGGILGGQLLGWRTVCAVESDHYAASVLAQRQNDGLLPPFPIWDDVRTFDGRPWKGLVELVSGGFPCQDISTAGKGGGIDGKRSGLWREMARIIGEVRPRLAFIENSPALVTRGLDRVLCDLAAIGYDAEWGVLSAADVGANHRRKRIWIVAHDGNADGNSESIMPVDDEMAVMPGDAADADSGGIRHLPRRKLWTGRTAAAHEPKHDGRERQMANSDRARLQERQGEQGNDGKEQPAAFGTGWGNSEWWQSEPDVGRVANGVAARVDRLRSIGNGQVPLCAATAFRLLAARLLER